MRLKGILGATAIFATLSYMGVTTYDSGIYERTWRAAAHAADRAGDNNKIISPLEYATIYKNLGKEDTGKMARDLSIKELRTYTDSQNKK